LIVRVGEIWYVHSGRIQGVGVKYAA
jgi:hypothetical protein